MSRYPPWGYLGPRLIARWALATQTSSVVVDGVEHVPARGPVLIVARHYHHLLDGAVLVDRLPRPVHIVVALDWAANARQRGWMERACALAGWPVILRPATVASSASYAAAETARYVRRGLREAVALLRGGRVVVFFPEGFPAIDPMPAAGAPARDAAGFGPFAPGYATVTRLAERLGGGPVPLIPLGFSYARDGARWRVCARFGAPLRAPLDVTDVERTVRALSAADSLSPDGAG